MSSALLYNVSEVTTSTGHKVVLSMRYTTGEKTGVSVLVAAAGISLLAVVYLLILLGISAYKTICKPSEHRFMRTHVVAYFICLLLSDAIAAVGSLMSGHWISKGGAFLGTFCTSQAALKNSGNVGTALWTMVIAIHTFCVVVLKWRSRDYVLFTTLIVVWTFIGLVVVIGPAAVENMASTGPYFGVSDYWCWITDDYSIQHVILEYLWMFLAALVSCLLYTVAFLSLRGNLIVSGVKLRLHFMRSPSIWAAQTGKDSLDGQAMKLAKQMLVYPIAYTALVLPIALCRFLEWSGHKVPFQLTIFADTVFVLSGFVNAVLFTTTRKIVPSRPWEMSSRSDTSGSDIESQLSVAPFIAEKISVSPIEKESNQQAVVVPLPIHMRKGSPGGASVTTTEASVYSQKTAGEPAVPILSIPIPRSQAVSGQAALIPQSNVTPLNVVKDPSRRKSLPDVPVGVGEGPEVDINKSYSGSPYSNPKTTPRALPQIPPAVRISHSESGSSSSSSSSNYSLRAPGTRF